MSSIQISKELDPVLHQYATSAYTYCCQWFRTPQDARRTVEIYSGKRNFCAYSFLLRRYYISLSPCQKTEDYCETIAHEMYHRVTLLSSSGKSGAFHWIDEMMAFLTTQYLLREWGFAEDALRNENYMRAKPKDGWAGLMRLKRRPMLMVTYRKRFYPKNLPAMSACIGMAFREIVPWEHLCRLPFADSFEAWKSGLPQEWQKNIEVVLHCATTNTGVIAANTGNSRLTGMALYEGGWYAETAPLLEAATVLEPHDATLWAARGHAFYETGQVEEAVVCYRKAHSLAPNTPFIQYSLANMLHITGHFKEAVSLFEACLKADANNVATKQCLERTVKAMRNAK